MKSAANAVVSVLEVEFLIASEGPFLSSHGKP